MDRLQEVKKELQGKTGMDPDMEETLFQKIAEIEENNGVLSPLPKADRLLAIIFAVVFGISLVICEAIGVL